LGSHQQDAAKETSSGLMVSFVYPFHECEDLDPVWNRVLILTNLNRSVNRVG
jgi:hypothetical protein